LGKSGVDYEQQYGDGDCIVEEGSTGSEMFIVASGRVRISKTINGGPVTLWHVERGDFFGEMSLLESLPRFASAYAEGETRLVVVQPGSLLLRVRQDPTLAVEMLTRLSSRLRAANFRLMAALGDADAEAQLPVWEGRDAHGAPDAS
jgi:CRP-like cAMP-binding protein